MKFYSTRQPAVELSLEDAVLRVPEADGGIVLADRCPMLPKAVFANIAEMSIDESAYLILSSLLGRDMPLSDLNALVRQTYTFGFPFKPETESHVYRLDLLTDEGHSHLELSAGFFAGLARILHRSDEPVFLSAGDDLFQQALRCRLGNSDSRLIILCRHDKTDATVASLGGCTSRHIYILSLTGSEENQLSMYDNLMRDKAFLNRNNVVVADGLNAAAYLPLTIVYFASVATLFKHEPNLREATLIINRADGAVLLAAAVARKMGLRIRFYVRNESATPLADNLREALERLGTDTSALFIDADKEKTLRSQANISAPVVIVNIPDRIRTCATSEQQRHRFYHVVRNHTALRKQIEIIK